MLRPGLVRPTGVERTFGDDEIIVSKTDVTGHIRYANDVFLRVSGYTEAQMLGAPHSVIRHPDMPRAVFQRMWDTIADGREIFAYVNNLAADGAHYWVLAHITPSRGAGGAISGYHSSRRRPDPAAVREIDTLYDALRTEERRHARTPDALAASTAMLENVLDAHGQSYDEFVWQLITRTTAGV